MRNRPRLFALIWLCLLGSVAACVDGGIESQGAPGAILSNAGAGSNTGSPAAAGSGSNVAVGPCFDTQSDPAHCGSCTNACAPGQACAQGSCKAVATSCAAPQTLCSGACVDLSSAAHCGSCDVSCVAGQTCNAGVCQCPGAQLACNMGCTDTLTDNDHCGGCNQPCAAGAACTAGACTCPTGQEACSNVCVDLTESEANCGACGKACAMGQTCSAGACITGAGADGCSGEALGVSVQQIDVYQTVKTRIMDAGAEVASNARSTDLVAGRTTLFRISVAVDSGFTARQLSARITVNNGSSATQYFGKQTLSKSSIETDTTTTFQVFVPAEQITVDTRYSAELVECATGSGTAGEARFPSKGEIELGARHTGGLKVKIIPLLANGKLPDTSETSLAGYRQILMAMYPIDAIELTVGSPLNITYPVDWQASLDQMRSKRSADKPAADVYYYGLLKPQDTLSQFCGGGCTTGIGYVGDSNSASYRVAMGVGYADRTSGQTLAHELGHNHGRNHSPCVPNGGQISGVDGRYPFPDGRTGILGFDSRTKVLLSDKGTDLMGYCSNVWLSEYTYNGIMDRVTSLNGNQLKITNTGALRTWRVLLLGSKGTRWGAPITQPSLPEGVPVSATILDAAGAAVATVTTYRTEVSDSGAASFMVPEPQAGWAAVQVPGSAALAFATP